MKPVTKEEKKKKRKIFKKEYIPVVIAILVLIILILVLLMVLFYKDEYGLKLPDAPSENNLSIEVYDFDSAKYDPNDLTQKEIKNTKVNYLFISDYYKEGIILSNTMVDYIDDYFLIYSGPFAETPYVSLVSKDGKLQWLNKLNKDGYDNIKIKYISKLDDYYYIFAVGTNKNSNDNMVIRINNKGNEDKREVLSKNSKNTLDAAIKIDKGFVVATDGEEGLTLYSLSKDLKLTKNVYNLLNDKNNIFHTYNPYVMALTFKDKFITAVIQYNGLQDEKMYLLRYNIDDGSTSITPFTELMRLDNPYTNKIYSMNGYFLVGHEDKVYEFDDNGKTVKTYDYAKIKLNDDDLVSDTGEKLEDYVSVEGLKTYDDLLFVSNTTNNENIYDIFDKDLNLKKRYVLNIDEYETKENVLLDVFYIDGKLYEVHSYGFETPSIMISVIG